MKSIGVCFTRGWCGWQWGKSARHHWSNEMNMRLVQRQSHLKIVQTTRLEKMLFLVIAKEKKVHRINWNWRLPSEALVSLLWSRHRKCYSLNCPRKFSPMNIECVIEQTRRKAISTVCRFCFKRFCRSSHSFTSNSLWALACRAERFRVGLGAVPCCCCWSSSCDEQLDVNVDEAL